MVTYRPAIYVRSKTRWRPALTKEQRADIAACHPQHGPDAFRLFCRKFVWVLHKSAAGNYPVLLEPWPSQDLIIDPMVKGDWLLALKGRQVGFTALMAPYVLWSMQYRDELLTCCINQEQFYAIEFVDRVKYTYQRLPPWMRVEQTRDHQRVFGLANRSRLIAVVGGSNAARSFTGDIAILDEMSRIPDLASTLAGVMPGLSGVGGGPPRGQIIGLTTSDGPLGEFAEFWAQTYGTGGSALDKEGRGPTGFRPIFIHYSLRPGRDAAWKKAEFARLEALPGGLALRKHEYPENVDEAFESAEGRVYALFSRARNVGTIEIPASAARCRAVDWGETKSAYVVVWIAYMRGPPGFLVDPSCTNTIREFLGYRMDEQGRPIKENDHTCDAVRYAVVRHAMRGLVYVYREIYRKDSVAAGWNPMKEIAEIHERSSWIPAGPDSRRHFKRGRSGEKFSLLTVCDRAMGKMINLFTEYDIPACPSPTFKAPKDEHGSQKDSARTEITEGIRDVAALIDGSEGMDHFYQIDRPEQALAILRQVSRAPVKVALSLKDRQIIEMAGEYLRKARRKQDE